jgi:hypothetical protein
MAVWIADVRFAPEIATELREKHDVTPDEVREAICFGRHERLAWHTHVTYGRRLVAAGSTSAGRRLIVYLRPLDVSDGTWECLTAWER